MAGDGEDCSGQDDGGIQSAPGKGLGPSAQPGAAVPHGSTSPRARLAQMFYRRNLPHMQKEGRPLFVTFSTHNRWELSDEARTVVFKHCLHDHGAKVHMHGFVVMPDHVHMVFTPLNDPEGDSYGLAEIMGGIKGASAHGINRMLRRRGHVWQDESFDHVLRCDEGVRQKVEYICQNPVRKGLVKSEDDYTWLWREWIEGDIVADEKV